MTGFEKFQEMVKDRILGFMPEEYSGASVDISHVKKNNGQEMAGLCIKKEGQEVAARIYLEKYYATFPEWASDRAILKAVAKDYMAAEAGQAWLESLAASVKDFDLVSENIQVQVVNKEKNRESLAGYPKKEVEGTDLVAVFCILFHGPEGACASALVTDALMDRWDISQESLYAMALENTIAKAPAQIRIMESMFSDDGETVDPKEAFQEDELYALTNAQRENGAAVLLYPGFLQSIAEGSGSSFCILPSSIHELLIMKVRDAAEASRFQGMVMEINRDHVSPQEVLSDQVFYYDRKEQKLSQATTPEGTRETLREISASQQGFYSDYALDR